MPPGLSELTSQIDIVSVPNAEPPCRVEVYQFPPSSVLSPSTPSSYEYIYILIPGNPGSACFYIPFLKELHERLNRKVPVIALGHGGHDLFDHNNGKVFSLNEQITHKMRFICHIHTLHPGAKLILSGHSLGAWVMLNVMERCPELEPVIEKAVFLFPTIKELVRGAPWVVWLCTMPPVRKLLAWLVHIFIRLGGVHFRRLMYKMLSFFLPAAASTIVAQGLRFSLVENIFGLAREEFHTITTLDAVTLQKHQRKMIFLYSEIDNWAPESHHIQTKAMLPHAAANEILRDGTDHSFVLYYANSTALKVASLLRLPQGTSSS
eukprot:GILJ01007986.1.p1 GENE.GILJ01007986.1~~GILJ01007986.1.p1  ORF type:complete len:321 (-),score=40.73 GILJ01007986.1:230-1192(-)